MTDRAHSTPTADGTATVKTGRRSLIKTLIGVALLVGLILWDGNGRKLIEVLGNFKPSYIVLLFAVAFATNAISSIKWGLFLKERGHALSFWRLFELYLIGKFFSNFLPSMFGGDVARSYFLGRQIASQSVSAASVVLERATGLVGLTILAVIGAAWTPSVLDDPIVAVAVPLTVIAVCCGVAAFYWPPFFKLFSGTAGRLPFFGKIARKIEKLLGDIGHYRSRHKLLAKGLAFSIAFHLVAVVNVYVTCLAIGFEPSFWPILAITPIILLLSMIPVSPNNVGWWEWCFSILLIGAGATAAEGLAVALVLRAVNFIMSLLGGLFLLRAQPIQQAAEKDRHAATY